MQGRVDAAVWPHPQLSQGLQRLVQVGQQLLTALLSSMYVLHVVDSASVHTWVLACKSRGLAQQHVPNAPLCVCSLVPLPPRLAWAIIFGAMTDAVLSGGWEYLLRAVVRTLLPHSHTCICSLRICSTQSVAR